jgi:hypothetical protein
MRGLCLLGAVALACGAVGLGCAKSKEAAPGPAVTVSETAGPGSASRAVTATATVEEVDQAKREVVLRTADGDLKRIHVGDEVRNLPQVRKGDVVTATYYESIALALRDATGEKPSVSVTQDMQRAPLGSMPSGVVTQQTTLKAKVTAVDRKKQTVTLEGPRGGTVTLKVEDPKKLDGVVVGHLVEAVYREAVVISVDKPTK